MIRTRHMTLAALLAAGALAGCGDDKSSSPGSEATPAVAPVRQQVTQQIAVRIGAGKPKVNVPQMKAGKGVEVDFQSSLATTTQVKLINNNQLISTVKVSKGNGTHVILNAVQPGLLTFKVGKHESDVSVKP